MTAATENANKAGTATATPSSSASTSATTAQPNSPKGGDAVREPVDNMIDMLQAIAIGFVWLWVMACIGWSLVWMFGVLS